MSDIEYNTKPIPAGLQKIAALNWPVLLLLSAISCVGFIMLFSVSGGDIDRWAQPQMKRFFIGITGMIAVAMVPIWFAKH